MEYNTDSITKDSFQLIGRLFVKTKNKGVDFPIVGIGASAGGLAAFESFFSGMPKNTTPNMAFVLIQHLSPTHESLLSEIIRHYTQMQVFEVTQGMEVAPNCIYVIPPNYDMALSNGAFELFERPKLHVNHLPIDFFFNSLAKEQKERAIAIILSGAGSDGSQGIEAIKSVGGMVMIQNPDDAEFKGMPSSAIATGLTDYILSPKEMPSQLFSYVSSVVKKPTNTSVTVIKKDKDALKKIFMLLHTHTGHDFSEYKPSTIYRRIERQMAIAKINTIAEYAQYLKQTPAEVVTLFHNLLIGVTSFFRDTEAFSYFKEKIIPKLFLDRQEGVPLRLWVCACSSGQEAYSIAILIQAYMDTHKKNFPVQIFATDIDAYAIAVARVGIYPSSIASQMSPQMLKRFFTIETNGEYKIHKSIRAMIVFSEHNAIKDPPFSKLDLISCRNLMIYMNAELQKKLISTFHYALHPNGFLFLGTSETVGKLDNVFAILNSKVNFYKKKEGTYASRQMSRAQFFPHTHSPSTKNNIKSDTPMKLSLKELTEQAILKYIAPCAALVDGQGDMLYVHGRMGKYLEVSSGVSGVNNIIKMAREGLQGSMVMALQTIKSSNETVHYKGLSVKTNAHFSSVDLTLSPVLTSAISSLEAPLYLVLIEESEAQSFEVSAKSDTKEAIKFTTNKQVVALKQELLHQKKFLQDANEKLEVNNQELKAYNEEMQSMNEELQSTNEELETSKEEIQSVNEELSTVNTELQSKLSDFSQASNDMNNLLSGTGIGTIFVDLKLQIFRFTPMATKIINLIPADIGRSVGHIVSNMVGYDRLVNDLQSVLDTLIPVEVEVQTVDGLWYAMHMQPYRTLENVIEGAVVSFSDITQVVRIRDDLEKANELLRLAVVVRDASDAITVQDLNGNILAWNPAAVKMYGWSEIEALKMNILKRIPKEFQADALEKLKQLSSSEILEPYLTKRITKKRLLVDVWITSTALIDETGHMYAIATTERVAKSSYRKPNAK